MAAPKPILHDFAVKLICGQRPRGEPARAVKTYAVIIAAFLVLLGVARILISYPSTAQVFDEPCHVAAALEFLDRGSYTLDAIHPPLARIAIGIALYVGGERYPTSGPGASSDNYNIVGNSILYDSGHYRRNLFMARAGVVPFFVFASLIVFFWAKRQFGELAGVLAVVVFTTLPIALAFSSVAYTDIVAAATQAAAFFALQLWLQLRSRRSCVVLGLAIGAAVLAKATTVIYLPAAAATMMVTKRLLNPEQTSARSGVKSTLWDCGTALIIASVVLWAGYRFSIGPVDDAMHLSSSSIPSFQHFPAPLRSAARAVVVSNPSLPAPAFLRGLAEAWVLNKSAPESYLLGQRKSGGYWYFFLVGVAVKTPIPVLILVLIGLAGLVTRDRRWTSCAPAVCAVAVLLVTMPVTYNAGVRHVLVVFPLLAILGGYGAAVLWSAKARPWMRAILLLLLAWQIAETIGTRHDYIAYFNEFAGRDPSQVLVAGCDLDCGQDVNRLAEALRDRHVSHVSLALWSSADMSKSGLPGFVVLQPNQAVSGWVAISRRALRFGDVFHNRYPQGAFDWLSGYQPTAQIGKSILLYNIPEENPSTGHNPDSRVQ